MADDSHLLNIFAVCCVSPDTVDVVTRRRGMGRGQPGSKVTNRGNDSSRGDHSVLAALLERNVVRVVTARK